MYLSGFTFTALNIQLSSLLHQKKFTLFLKILNWVFTCEVDIGRCLCIPGPALVSEAATHARTIF